MTHVRNAVIYPTILVLASCVGSLEAGVIVNGDFASFDNSLGLPTGWDHFDDGGRFTPPDYDDINQWMLFHENNQLEQLFDLPATALTLSFDFRFFQTGDGATGVPPDSFQVTLYDSSFGTLLGAPFGFFTIDHVGSYYEPNYVTVSALTDGWQRVTLDVSSLAPMADLLLEFLVNGSDDGRTTTAVVDNVVVDLASATSVVPEPTSLGIFLGLAFSCWVSRRRRRQK